MDWPQTEAKEHSPSVAHAINPGAPKGFDDKAPCSNVSSSNKRNRQLRMLGFALQDWAGRLWEGMLW